MLPKHLQKVKKNLKPNNPIAYSMVSFVEDYDVDET
jgi:hypothetical protein